MEMGTASQVVATKKSIGRDVRIGDDVYIECSELILGDNVCIGLPTEESFRCPGGVRIRVNRLVLDDNVSIGRSVLIKGGAIHLAQGTIIREWNTIDVRTRLEIGQHGVVNKGCEISGREIAIGRELWMLPEAKIGGGSAFEVHSALLVGDYCHIGMRAFINTARRVRIGNEVGLGTGTALYTHGAYPSVLHGFPVRFGEIEIGDYTWIPGAIVNPGVRIGRNCVIGVNSLVNSDIPDGCLAGGSPARIIKERIFPRTLCPEKRAEFFREFLCVFSELCGVEAAGGRVEVTDAEGIVVGGTRLVFKERLSCGDIGGMTNREICITYAADLAGLGEDFPEGDLTVLDVGNKKAYGVADELSERVVNQLRRYGMRLYAGRKDRRYVNWQ
jgi:acetyltransferase-like isoleucine patch superfamily enzyme